MSATFGVQSQWPLVGREDVLGQVTAALRSNSVSVVLVTGASGIGKSRLAAEAAAALGADGWSVIRVVASAMMSATPLGALIPAIAPGRDALDSVVRDSLAIFDLVREAVDRLSDGRRVIAVVDDLPLLDPLSMTAIVQLVAVGAISLIATVRSGESIPDALTSLWTSDLALRVEVSPLGIGDIETLLSSVLGGRVAHRAAIALEELSGGNALFLRELVIGAVQDGQLREHDGVWQLVGTPLGTPALRDLIQARLQHLDAQEAALIQRLAVCQPLTIDDLPTETRAPLIALEGAGLVLAEERGGRTMVSIAHPQYAEAIRASLSRLATSELLANQADLVASREVTPEDELRVALWRLDAGVQSDPEILFRAAHLATLAGDHPRAERLAGGAISAGAHAAEMLLLQGRAVWTLGRISEAIGILERAAKEDQANPTSRELTGEIAEARASAYAGEVDGNTLGLGVLDRAIDLDPELAPMLALPRAVLLLNLEEASRAGEALELARPTDETDERARAIYDFALALPLSALGMEDAAIEAGRAAVAHAARSIQPAFGLRRAQMALETVLLQAGHVREAQELATQSLQACIERDDELGTRYNELMLGHCFLARGQLETAGRWFGDVISGSQARASVFYLDQARAMLALTLLWRGRPREAAAVLAEIPARIVSANSTASLASLWLDGVRGGRARATTAMIRRANEAESRGHLVLAASLLHAAARLGAAREAAGPLTALAARTTSRLAAAQAAHATAEASGELRELVEAAELWESLGYRLFAAEAYVSASSAARAGDDAREAASLQNRADILLADCEGAATPLLQFARGSERLTQREHEIAALAALGLSSVEIGARLHISPRTVDNHLHAVYDKLGIRRRSELREL